MASSRRKLEQDEAMGELNIVPYLDILMNLIIFMLLSMAGLATFGMLNVSAQRDPSRGDGARPALSLTVSVTKTGFFVTTGEAVPSEIPRTARGAYDYHALTAKLQELKLAFPSESRLVVVAESDTEYEVLIATLDATRETAERTVLFPDVTLASY